MRYKELPQHDISSSMFSMSKKIEMINTCLIIYPVIIQNISLQKYSNFMIPMCASDVFACNIFAFTRRFPDM